MRFQSVNYNKQAGIKPIINAPSACDRFDHNLTKSALAWYNHPRQLLGVRLVVGQQTLDLYAEVRILDPQPDYLPTSRHPEGDSLRGALYSEPGSTE